MKKVILVAAASLAFIATSFAQNAAPAKQKMVKAKPTMEAPTQGTPAPAQAESAQMEKAKNRGNGEGRAQNGMNTLGLTPEQETQFKAANKAHKDAVKVIQMNESLAIDAKKAQIADLSSEYEVKVKAIMNAEQFEKWLAMRAKRNENNGGDRKKGDHKSDHNGKVGHDKMGDNKLEEPKRDEQGHTEGTEGYDPKPDPNAPQTPVDPNKRKKAQKPTGMKRN